MAQGTGAAGGVARLFEAGGLGPTSPIAAVTETELAAIADLAAAFQQAGGGRPAAFATLLPPPGSR